MTQRDKLEALRTEYRNLCAMMQTGVAFKMMADPSETTPKHLRVGVNSAMVEHAGLVRLLLVKGIISEEEYYIALVQAMKEEVDSYKRFLEDVTGKTITLGPAGGGF